MLNIVVFGTSNCFPGSEFIKSLGTAARVENHSLGASTSIHANLAIDQVDFARFDFCLLDFAINDELARRNGVAASRLVDSFESIAARAWKAGCLPVVLIFPTRTDDKGESATRKIHLDLAKNLSLPYLDFFEVVSELTAADCPFSYAGAFQDQAHLCWWMMAEFARFCVAALGRLAEPKAAVVADWTYRRYSARPLSADVTSSFAVVERSSSIRRGNFLRMTPGPEARVALPSDAVVAGYAANFKDTYCVVVFRGEGATGIDLRSPYIRWKGDLALCALHLPSEIKAKEGSVELSAYAKPEDAADVFVFDSNGLDASFGDYEPAAELSHLILRHESLPVLSTRPDPSLHVNLWRAMSSEAKAAVKAVAIAQHSRVVSASS